MSTRATYSFNHSDEFTTYFYIHSDNYPEGAAAYLLEMYKVSKEYSLDGVKRLVVKNNDLTSAFLVGNSLSAEFTRHHEAHCDTEYRYYLMDDGMMRAEKIQYQGEDGQFVAFFNGHYTQFINQYYAKKQDEDFEGNF